MAAKQFQQQFGVAPTTTISKTTKLPPIKEDVFSLKQRIQEVNQVLFIRKTVFLHFYCVGFLAHGQS